MKTLQSFVSDHASWKHVHGMIMEICISMYPLDVTPYVLLQIIDYLPLMK
jgi:hypothetical protein